MGREERKARRAAKKAARKERRIQLNRFMEAVKNSNIQLKPDGDADIKFVDVFKEIWEILDPALKYAIAMDKTKANTDEVLEQVWSAGNAIANGGGADAQSQFIQKFRQVWGKIEDALDFLQFLIKDEKISDTIDDVLEIGDWIADEGE